MAPTSPGAASDKAHASVSSGSAAPSNMKLSQSEAGYIIDDPVGQPCGRCAMFRAPRDCTAVDGYILPGGHCNLFAAAPLFEIDDGVHRDFLPTVDVILGALLTAYPQAKLSAVRLFERPGDRSLAHVEGVTIMLNALWFSRPRAALAEAALLGRASAPYGAQLWHGGMPDTPLPYHLLTHEFGHLLATATPGAVEFSAHSHAAALNDPSLAASGYALVDPDEWWGETFAALRLGAPTPQAAEMQAFLARP